MIKLNMACVECCILQKSHLPSGDVVVMLLLVKSCFALLELFSHLISIAESYMLIDNNYTNFPS